MLADLRILCQPPKICDAPDVNRAHPFDPKPARHAFGINIGKLARNASILVTFHMIEKIMGRSDARISSLHQEKNKPKMIQYQCHHILKS